MNITYLLYLIDDKYLSWRKRREKTVLLERIPVSYRGVSISEIEM